MALGDLRKWLSRHESILFPVGIALGARIVLSLVGAWIVTTTAIQSHFEFYNYALTPLAPDGLNVLLAPFQRWDAVWYELIARRGYSASDPSASFFPLFPLLIRVFALGTNATLFAGTLAAMLCTIVLFILFYHVTRDLFDQKTARLGLVVWAAFPTSFYLFTPYAEALFALCAIVSLEAARRRNWVWAGIAGGEPR